jgi:hypothetical protein
MATNKVDIEDVKMVLAAKDLGINRDVQLQIMQELTALLEMSEKEKDDTPKIKNEFLVMPIVSNEEEQVLFRDRQYVVLQKPETIEDPEEVLNFISQQLAVFVESPAGRRNCIRQVCDAVGKIKPKDLVMPDGNKIKIKTKEPVQGIPILNDLL